ncbi:MAG: hypothetical protein FJW91_05085 [Actinobacteria bacterium]|nr:hypothetical protein [Actinomycetota bacterium]
MRSRVVATIIVGSLFLTSCAAGGNAPTRLIKQVTDGVEKDSGDLKVRNVKIIALPDGTGTLIGFIVNHSDDVDQLVAITVGGQRADLVTDVQLLRNRPMFFEGDSANAKAKIATLGVKPGYRVPVILYFAKNGKVELDALVVANTGIYSSIL